MSAYHKECVHCRPDIHSHTEACACVCRQAKDKKQHCRGIFITTSRFTQVARKILEETSDKFVGYDGQDLFECAKECGFGIVQKNGVFVLDEELLSGEKAFFRMF